MAAMRMRRGPLIVAAVLAVSLSGPAFASGIFKGTFGTEKFKSRKIAAGCVYSRANGSFSASGGMGNRKKQKGAGAAGYGADPTAPGAVFPIVLTSAAGSFFSGPPTAPPTWTGSGDGVTVTLTGYKKGKVSGTMTGTMQPTLYGATGTIQVNATFSAKCTIF
jgi:hypothetical protein